MRVAFFGTSPVSAPFLERLDQSHRVVAVATAPDKGSGRGLKPRPSAVAQTAVRLALPVLKPERLKGNVELAAALRELSPDVSVVVSYGKIIPPELLSLPALGTVNVHYSLLPKYRGASPVQAAILAGDRETGVSIMLMDELLDHGPILTQARVPVGPDETAPELFAKLNAAALPLLLETLERYASGSLVPVQQDHRRATACGLVVKEDGRVNWQRSAGELYRAFLAYQPWPGLWTTWNGKVLKVTRCAPSPTQTAGAPGTVLAGGAVACGSGTLRLDTVQLEGKKETPVADFLRGHRDFAGSTLV